MDRPEWAPPDVDLNTPSAARVWDFFLDGAHNFAVDRQVAAEAIRFKPDLPELARAVRAFLRHSVRLMAHAGIDQFIDVGAGLPTVGNVHEVAARVNPQARVVYIDRDPVAVTHGKAMLAGNDRVAAIAGDIRDPAAFLKSPELSRLIDFDRPVGLLLCAVLHFVGDDADPAGCVATLVERMVPGSYLAIQHATHDAQSANTIQMLKYWNSQSPEPMTWRTRTEIAAFFHGFTLTEPGLVELTSWLPDEPAGADPARFASYAGIGRKNP
ncbi:SAM-dependent methyltransferase [Micromonospora sp. CPCC 206061]|uniref:SAM-dependent methyltransferase n=1 Tax=Micromonospora sp. CPCC 206061 TaxID=3122410 RepID=UPI002FF337CD